MFVSSPCGEKDFRLAQVSDQVAALSVLRCRRAVVEGSLVIGASLESSLVYGIFGLFAMTFAYFSRAKPALRHAASFKFWSLLKLPLKRSSHKTPTAVQKASCTKYPSRVTRHVPPMSLHQASSRPEHSSPFRNASTAEVTPRHWRFRHVRAAHGRVAHVRKEGHLRDEHGGGRDLVQQHGSDQEGRESRLAHRERGDLEVFHDGMLARRGVSGAGQRHEDRVQEAHHQPQRIRPPPGIQRLRTKKTEGLRVRQPVGQEQGEGVPTACPAISFPSRAGRKMPADPRKVVKKASSSFGMPYSTIFRLVAASAAAKAALQVSSTMQSCCTEGSCKTFRRPRYVPVMLSTGSSSLRSSSLLKRTT
eukprot:scaffold1492_cov257-Pinguiococcus_pyrenoidosus.AAC.14